MSTPCKRIQNCEEVGGNTILIDPNPFNETVEHEDLIIYANLRTRLRGRSILIKDEGIPINIGFSQIKTEEINQEIDFIQPGGKIDLTTDWTEIGGEREEGRDYETFGITNISIDIKSSFVPKVVIDFVDVRGATLFEQGPCSPYAAFFHLPYPMFELTIKGYYGKPLKYYLHLTKFNTRFNPQNGNYESKGEFIGYTFAFLSDMLMGYISAAGYMSGSGEKLKGIYESYLNVLNKKGINLKGLDPLSDGKDPENGEEGSPMRIRDLWLAVDELQKIQAKIGRTEELQEITVLETLGAELTSVRENIDSFVEEWESVGGKIVVEGENKVAIYKTSSDNNPSNEALTKERKLKNVFNNYFLDSGGGGGIIVDSVDFYNTAVNENNSVADANNIKINKDQLPKQLSQQSIESVVGPGVSTFVRRVGQGIKFGSTGLLVGTVVGLFEGVYEVVDELTTEEGDLRKNITFIYADLTKLENEIVRAGEFLNSEIGRIKDVFNEKVNQVVIEQVGFTPTILNIFIVLLANTELFLQLLLEASEDAEEYHQNNPEQVDPSLLDSDFNGKIYAWPTYRIRKEEGELEEYPGNEFLLKEWPEVTFVEDFLEALIKLQRDKEVLENPEEIVYEGRPGYDNYFPINAYETPLFGDDVANGYLGKNKEEDILSEIGNRLNILVNHTMVNTDWLLTHSPIIDNLEPEDRIKTNQTIEAKRQNISVSEDPSKVGQPYIEFDTRFIKSIESLTEFSLNPFIVRGSRRFFDKNKSFNETENIKFSNENIKFFGKIEGFNAVNTLENRELISRLQVIFSNTEEAKQAILKATGFNPDPNGREDIYVYDQTLPNYKGEPTLNANSNRPIEIKSNPHTMKGDDLINIKLIDISEGVNIDGRQIAINDEKVNEELEKLNERFRWNGSDYDGTKRNFFSSAGFKVGFNFISVTNGLGDGDINKDANLPINGTPFAPAITSPSGEVIASSVTLFNQIAKHPLSPDLDLDYTEVDDDLPGETFKYGGDLQGLPIDDETFSDAVIKIGNLRQMSGVAELMPYVYDPDDVFGANTTAGVNEGWLGFNGFNSLKLIGEISNPTTSTNGNSLLINSPWWELNYQNGYKPFLPERYNIEYNFDTASRNNKLEKFEKGGSTTNSQFAVGINDGPWKGALAYLFLASFYHRPWGGVYDNNFTYPTPQQIFGRVSLTALIPRHALLLFGAILWRAREYGLFLDLSRVGNFTQTDGRQFLKEDPVISWNNPPHIQAKSVALNGSYKFIHPEPFDWPIPAINKEIISFDEDVEELDKYGKLYATFNEESFKTLNYDGLYVGGLSPDKGYNRLNALAFNGLDNNGLKESGYFRAPYEATTDLYKDEDLRTSSGSPTQFRWVYGYLPLGVELQNLPAEVKNKFIKEFEDFVGDFNQFTGESDFDRTLEIIDPLNFPQDQTDEDRLENFNKAYKVVLGQKGGINTKNVWSYSDAVFTNFEFEPEALQFLIQEFYNKQYVVTSSTPKIWWGLKSEDFGGAFILTDEQLDSFIEGFREVLSDKSVKEKKDELIEANLAELSAIEDEDIKLSLYRSFKSLNDKWISSSSTSDTNPTLFYNIFSERQEQKPLIEYFSFVNRTNSNIGDRAVMDLVASKDLLFNSRNSLYYFISELLAENNFNFHALPNYTDLWNLYTSEDENTNEKFSMFDPQINLSLLSSSPHFICMYVGGVSRLLDLNTTKDGFSCGKGESVSQFETDSWTFNDPPEDFTDNESGGVVAFRVKFGNQNQNHFLSVDLDQQEFKETQESLIVIDELSKGQGQYNNSATKGQNLYNLYLNRSYTAKVESMGNMSIQPLMYFNLENVPMFYGSYLVLDVEHQITPNNAKTRFTGVRVPIATVPIVEDVATLIDIIPSESGDLISLDSLGGSGTGGAGGAGILTGFDRSLPFDLEPNQVGELNFASPLDTLILNSPTLKIRTSDCNGGKRLHLGADLGIGVDNPVYAIQKGRAYVKKNVGGYGLYVIIEHDESDVTPGFKFFSLYGHLNSVDGLGINDTEIKKLWANASDGAILAGPIRVQRGQRIGLSGGGNSIFAGSSDGPHLHFEIRKLLSSDTVGNYFVLSSCLTNYTQNVKSYKIDQIFTEAVVDSSGRTVYPIEYLIPNNFNYPFKSSSDSHAEFQPVPIETDINFEITRVEVT